ncbi:hypothetical protein ASC89_19325 [Devosia sp. Root413D1]|uniref:Nmad2 family putative nucleotide modification protein n=1 Tax=Devosia sp. Root413D1 TaxID=1736531 RepID=UPI0006F49BC7|nr:hypothetical protein [Devosia sp. Root413D1]KQW77342.1 hypothetical protein ASC89_19325 [Devosia sp. Root413D1]
MKGYIYKLYAGADPSMGWEFNDPIFGKYATLGACMPNIRRFLDIGDWVFALSGKVPERVPYVIGGFKVDEKLDALDAYERFPEYRLKKNERGQVIGNIIVNADGEHNALDDHDQFAKRRQNYLVGKEAVAIVGERAIELARARTHGMLERILKVRSNNTADLVPRWRGLNEEQVKALVQELRRLQGGK